MNEPNYISGSSGSEANDMDNENDGWSLDSIEQNVPHVEVVNIPHPIRNQDDPPNLFHLLDDDSVSNPVSHNGVNDEDLVGYDNMLTWWEVGSGCTRGTVVDPLFQVVMGGYSSSPMLKKLARNSLSLTSSNSLFSLKSFECKLYFLIICSKVLNSLLTG